MGTSGCLEGRKNIFKYLKHYSVILETKRKCNMFFSKNLICSKTVVESFKVEKLFFFYSTERKLVNQNTKSYSPLRQLGVNDN